MKIERSAFALLVMVAAMTVVAVPAPAQHVGLQIAIAPSLRQPTVNPYVLPSFWQTQTIPFPAAPAPVWFPAAQVPFVSPQIPFVSTQVPFVSTQTQFFSAQTQFVSTQTQFVSTPSPFVSTVPSATRFPWTQAPLVVAQQPFQQPNVFVVGPSATVVNVPQVPQVPQAYFGLPAPPVFPNGTPRAQVLAQLGQPSVTVITSTGETLYFNGGVTVIIQNGQVITGPR